MITVKNINGAPESKPERFVGVYSDEDFFCFFETKEEMEEFLNALPPSPETPEAAVPAVDIPALLQTQTPEQLQAIANALRQYL